MNTTTWTTAEEAFLTAQLLNTKKSRLALYQSFVKKFGFSRSLDSVQRKITRLQANGVVPYRKLVEDALRIGFADIEASDLQGNFGFMLSYYIKPRGENTFYHALATSKELRSTTHEEDYRVVKQFLSDLQHFDVLYFFYGQDYLFDSRFLRARIVANGLEQDYQAIEHEVYLRDIWPIIKQKFAFSNNRQITVADHFKIPIEKTQVLPRLWRQARRGDPKALKYVDEHNKRDVLQLEQLYEGVKIFAKAKNTF